jgi:hypothetical protein
LATRFRSQFRLLLQIGNSFAENLKSTNFATKSDQNQNFIKNFDNHVKKNLLEKKNHGRKIEKSFHTNGLSVGSNTSQAIDAVRYANPCVTNGATVGRDSNKLG